MTCWALSVCQWHWARLWGLGVDLAPSTFSQEENVAINTDTQVGKLRLIGLAPNKGRELTGEITGGHILPPTLSAVLQVPWVCNNNTNKSLHALNTYQVPDTQTKSLNFMISFNPYNNPPRGTLLCSLFSLHSLSLCDLINTHSWLVLILRWMTNALIQPRLLWACQTSISNCLLDFLFTRACVWQIFIEHLLYTQHGSRCWRL